MTGLAEPHSEFLLADPCIIKSPLSYLLWLLESSFSAAQITVGSLAGGQVKQNKHQRTWIITPMHRTVRVPVRLPALLHIRYR